ncbi:MAG: T9SS type A sorting domain-containing protein [Bacteroidota bacterium]
MRKITLSIICLFVFTIGVVKAQQVNNSGFENWDNLATATEEPSDWNSFKSASGDAFLLTFAAQQVARSTQKRPGSTGAYSAVIWSRTILTVTANGNITTGQINMGSSTATDPSNYNISHTALPAFREALGGTPDSLVVWVRFKPANVAGTDSARIHATIHDTYDCKDPIDAGSATHVVGEATLNFATTNNIWVRKSFAFNYAGPATSPDYILISLTTNKTPGGGTGGDSLYIDDLELKYNDASIGGVNYAKNINVYTDAHDLVIKLLFEKQQKSNITIYNMRGQVVYNTQINATASQKRITLDTFNKGVYVVDVVNEDGQRFSQKVIIK